MTRYDLRKRRILVFKVTDSDAKNLASVAEKLDISLSELLRRSVRLGSRVLEDFKLPGSAMPDGVKKKAWRDHRVDDHQADIVSSRSIRKRKYE